MPPLSFFRGLGLFIREDFFTLARCLELQTQISGADSERATVVGLETGQDYLDENVRKVLSAKAEDSAVKAVWDAIWDLKPSLEDHFRVSLRASECPTFLRYGKGAFYRPHKDGNADSSSSTRNRKVSLVIFLNGTSGEDSPNCYGGGALRFYGLMDGPTWEKCAFALEAKPGLLVAFRSDTVHEVQPVTFGERFTIVSWFSV